MGAMTEAEEDKCLEKLASLWEAVLEEALVREAKASMRCWVPCTCSLWAVEKGVGVYYIWDCGGGVEIDVFYSKSTPRQIQKSIGNQSVGLQITVQSVLSPSVYKELLFDDDRLLQPLDKREQTFTDQ